MEGSLQMKNSEVRALEAPEAIMCLFLLTSLIPPFICPEDSTPERQGSIPPPNPKSWRNHHIASHCQHGGIQPLQLLCPLLQWPKATNLLLENQSYSFLGGIEGINIQDATLDFAGCTRFIYELEHWSVRQLRGDKIEEYDVSAIDMSDCFDVVAKNGIYSDTESGSGVSLMIIYSTRGSG